MGAWERGELGQRLHFHALTYFPEGEMPGELEEHEDYSTKRHKREKAYRTVFSTRDSAGATFQRSAIPLRSATASNICSNISARTMKK